MPKNNSINIQPSDTKKCPWCHKICFFINQFDSIFLYVLVTCFKRYVSRWLFWCMWLWPSKLLQCSFPSHLCKLHRSRISENRSIRLLVACVPDQLAVPHPEVMLPVCPLGEDGNSRSAHQRQGVMMRSLWWIYTSNPLIQASFTDSMKSDLCDS